MHEIIVRGGRGTNHKIVELHNHLLSIIFHLMKIYYSFMLTRLSFMESHDLITVSYDKLHQSIPAEWIK